GGDGHVPGAGRSDEPGEGARRLPGEREPVQVGRHVRAHRRHRHAQQREGMMRRLLRDQQGIALVMALGILITLTITTLAVLTYTTANVRGARYGHARVSAYSLAEAGTNAALAVLNLVTNSVQVATPLYVEGDLCLNNGASVQQGSHGTTLVVKGRLTLANSQQNFVGATKQGNNIVANPITAAYIGNSCVLQNNAAHSP